MKTVVSVMMCVSMFGGCLALSGCSTSFAPEAGGSAATSVGKIQGIVHGGQQPLAGARVYVYETSITGYGGSGIPASSNNASTSLLTNATGNYDGNNYYVTTDSGGNFVVTGDYSCDANQVVYMYAVGGDAGAGDNSDIGLMAVLGVCPNSGADMSSVTPYVFMDEVTTVAAAYALSGFATDAVHIGSNSTSDPLALQGIQNAAANAANIVNIATGQAYTTTPGSVTNNVGIVPYQNINTLANILASCINSSGSASTACGTLFSKAQANGSYGGQATDTATVAINIAHNPATNISPLYGLQPGTGVPFPSDLSRQPNDFSLPVMYSGGGINVPFMLAVDGSGNIWVSNQNGNSLSEFSPLGVAQSDNSFGFTGGGLSDPTGIAIDSSNDVWVKNGGANVISEFDSTGRPISSTGYTPANYNASFTAAGIAFDAAGNLWVTGVDSSSNPMFMEVNTFGSTGTAKAGPFTGGGQSGGDWLAVDPRSSGNGYIWTANGNGSVSQFTTGGASEFSTTITGMSTSSWLTFDSSTSSNGDAWIVDSNSYLIAELDPTNGNLLTSSNSSPDGQGYSSTVEVDAAGNIWTANGSSGNNSISQIEISGTFIFGSSTSTTGYINPDPLANPSLVSMQLDGSGNVWAVDNNGMLIQWVGLSAPQYTPVNPTKYATLP